MQEIETRIKVAELKEEKINGLLNQLDQIMVNYFNNIIFIEIYREQLKLLHLHADDDWTPYGNTLWSCILQEMYSSRYLPSVR